MNTRSMELTIDKKFNDTEAKDPITVPVSFPVNGKLKSLIDDLRQEKRDGKTHIDINKDLRTMLVDYFTRIGKY